MATKTVQLVPLGNVPQPLLKELEPSLSVQMGVVAVPGSISLPTPDYAFNKDRRQYHSSAILRRLAALVDGAHFAMIAVTDVDLFEPDTAFIFGEADRESRVALISVCRLQEASGHEVLKRRLLIEIAHQTGRLLGLSFCEEPRCIMYLPSSLAECDRKNLSLCNVCRNELAKLNR
jgi:archaemetzincin